MIARVAAWDDVPRANSVDDVGDLACAARASSTPTCTSTSRAAPSGRASRRATRAAAAGGVTTLVDMPLNSIPPTTTREALRGEARGGDAGSAPSTSGSGAAWCRATRGELAGLVADGVRGFKCFLVDSGVDGVRLCRRGASSRRAMPILARLGVPLLVHAELAGPIDAAAAQLDAASIRAATRRISRRARPRPRNEAIELIIAAVPRTARRARTSCITRRRARCRCCARRAREGLPLTAETCPHYLHFAAEAIPDGATAFKCAPPIRDAANREALWRGARRGRARSGRVAITRRARPNSRRSSSGDFMAAWGGVAGLQLALPVVWTEASAARSRARRPRALDVRGAGAARGPHRQEGRDRGRRRRRSRRVRPTSDASP